MKTYSMTNDFGTLLFFFGLCATEIINNFIPSVMVFGYAMGTGTASFLVYLLLKCLGILLVKGYHKLLEKIEKGYDKLLEKLEKDIKSRLEKK